MDQMIEAVAHRAYMQELEKKIPAFTILSTTFLACKVVESKSLQRDNKADDVYINADT